MDNTAEYVVAKDFRDKFTREYHSAGSDYTSDDPERISFLQRKGYIKRSNGKKAAAEREKEPDQD